MITLVLFRISGNWTNHVAAHTPVFRSGGRALECGALWQEEAGKGG